MSGGWSRYTRNAASGSGCGEAIIAGLFFVAAIGMAVHYLPDDGTVDQNMHGTTARSAR